MEPLVLDTHSDPKARYFREECDSVLSQFDGRRSGPTSSNICDCCSARSTSTRSCRGSRTRSSSRSASTSASTRRCHPASTSKRSRRSSSSSRGSGPTGSRRDLAFYSEGIFPLYRHASYSVRPVLLDLFERYYVPLGPRAVPCLPGLVLALLSAMEDVGSEFYHRAVKLLDSLYNSMPSDALMSALWCRLLHNATVRYRHSHTYPCAFRCPPRPPPLLRPTAAAPTETPPPASSASTTAAVPPPSNSLRDTRDPSRRFRLSRAAFCPDAQGTVIKAILVSLQHGDSLVRRTALELLNNHFPLPREAGVGMVMGAAIMPACMVGVRAAGSR